ncbi:hypothetical protein HPG69_019094 [Diceros bicornis minor]|uniref:Sphingosine-1-phosphate phosphatase 2 n=1 Tax=Diceros bicornis minor TaxID=77932 RepID=A0A7J7EJQ0_DICBM|nr:hypothetical protein HPG69_019094 [Diceros bicornis minor]
MGTSVLTTLNVDFGNKTNAWGSAGKRILCAVILNVTYIMEERYIDYHLDSWGHFVFLDVLGGVLITVVFIVLTYPAWTLIDRLDSASPLFPVCVIVVPFFLCYNYPVSEYYSPSRADTTTILAAGAGVTIGFWINHFFQLMSKPTESFPVTQNIPPLTTDVFVLGLTKFTVGIVLILLVRQLVQNLSLQVLFSWFKVVTRNKEARQRLEIEVPYKFVTYTSVGICATTFVPMLHKFLGLL